MQGEGDVNEREIEIERLEVGSGSNGPIHVNVMTCKVERNQRLEHDGPFGIDGA